ncbi:TetR/AcrR family transcriptional regulator, partial [Streptomyces cyaneofuscatus]|uniref:TetR/AcrR family transcriptional regulator n=1 Tax=Streptomyces cyaneofuscatus TaxID=66883 RepID=UPI0036C66A61
MKPTPGRPGRRPGRAPSLTRDAVADAALAEGVAVFSMPGVAARLGVSHSTLYRYVDSRDDLVRAAVGRAPARPPRAPADRPRREQHTPRLLYTTDAADAKSSVEIGGGGLI